MFQRKPSISLKNLSPVSVCTPPRQAVSLPRVVTNYPSAVAQIAMAGQAKGVDFQKNCFYHTNLISELFQNHLRYAQIDYLIILEYYAFGLQQASLSLNPAERV